MAYWLMKSEPMTYSLNDLQQAGQDCWDGVRNYQARNFMRDHMQPGDGVLFYHSNCNPPAIVGLAEVAGAAYPDPTQFDPHSPYFDPKSNPEGPRWYLVDLRYVRHLRRPIPLSELKAQSHHLNGLALLRKGNRLSVMPVDPRHWDFILALETAPSGNTPS